LLGLADVLVTLGDARRGRGEHRRERAVVAEVGLGGEQPVDEHLAVHQQRDGLPNPLVVQGFLVGAHVDLAMRRRAQLGGDHIGIGEGGATTGHRELLDEIDLAAWNASTIPCSFV